MHLALPHGIRSTSVLASPALQGSGTAVSAFLAELLGTQRQAIGFRSQELPAAITSRPDNIARPESPLDVIRTSLLGVGAPLGRRRPAAATSMTTLRPAPAMHGRGKKQTQQHQQEQQAAQQQSHGSRHQHYDMDHGVSPTSSELSECLGSTAATAAAVAARAAAAAAGPAGSLLPSCSYETDLRGLSHQLQLKRRVGASAAAAAAPAAAAAATASGGKRKLHLSQSQSHQGQLFADADDERRFFGLPPVAPAAAIRERGCSAGHSEGCGCGESSAAAAAAASAGAATWVATPGPAMGSAAGTTTGATAAAVSAADAAKSAKRRAAEALLAQRFGGGGAAGSAVAIAAQAATATLCVHSSSLILGSSGAGGSEDTSSGSDTDGPAAPAVAAARAAALRRHAAERLGAVGAAAAGAATATAAASPLSEGTGQVAKRPRLDLSALAAGALGQRASVPGPAAGAGRRSTAAGGSTGAAAGGGAGGGGAAPRLVMTTVPPCDPARGCRARMPLYSGASALAEAAAAAAAGQGAGAGSPTAPVAAGPAWCGFEVKVPSLNWQAVFDEPPGSLARYPLARGYEKLVLPEGLAAYCVESAKHVEDALLRLRASMTDRVIAIDLEWRPETVAGRTSPVALVQLASATTCLLLRVSAMGYSLPAPVAAFLSDPSLVVLGFSWDGADEAKMRSTFGTGKARFRRFIDLQEVAASLGYHGYGLARLTRQILGVPLQKSKSVSRSNWAAPQLTAHQLKYASLDVLAAGQLFRALRLWHSSPSPCADCRNAIGEPVPLVGEPAGEPGAPGAAAGCSSPAYATAGAASPSDHDCDSEPECGPAAATSAAAAGGARGVGGGAAAGPLLKCNAPGCHARGVLTLQSHLSHCAATGHPARYGACGSCGRTYELAAAAAAAAGGRRRQQDEEEADDA